MYSRFTDHQISQDSVDKTTCVSPERREDLFCKDRREDLFCYMIFALILLPLCISSAATCLRPSRMDVTHDLRRSLYETDECI
jgi:hypothetical protein